MTKTKTIDERGRIVIGMTYAHQSAKVERISEDEFRVKLVRMVPASEAWLYDNSEAHEAVAKGLEAAKNRIFVEGPDLAADLASLAEPEE